MSFSYFFLTWCPSKISNIANYCFLFTTLGSTFHWKCVLSFSIYQYLHDNQWITIFKLFTKLFSCHLRLGISQRILSSEGYMGKKKFRLYIRKKLFIMDHQISEQIVLSSHAVGHPWRFSRLEWTSFWKLGLSSHLTML